MSNSGEMQSARLTVSVLIATINRPDHTRICIEHLLAQIPPPDQIVVIDASRDDLTRISVAAFPDVLYIANPGGRGNTPNSRNAGIKAATGEIIAFLDDDAYAHPGWLSNLVQTYEDPTIGAVAGRALNNQPGEETEGVNDIGKILPTGEICGFFAADSGKIIDVDHMLGANMSFRRDVVLKLGGFRDDVPAGPSGICEETDMSLRVKKSGYRIVYNPFAVADHVAAPQFKGKRFDHRWTYFVRRNQLLMFIRNYGFGKLVVRYVVSAAVNSIKDFLRRIGGAFIYLGANIAGVVMGIAFGTKFLIKERRNPLRQNGDAPDIRRHLESVSQRTSSE